ncbi:hypothetical protein ACRE_073730 [Hapsidospora chrysogenum ATCC 11550]|uniref:Uncharacterized protein n=1 Tax=Hapsidospora chrysogenum (strain ATCC 11550 / CBS 779.69 / DSM 880 / IAM 14645 / JCM 23072 / IMI 49137) TaxID=857340 RepID=A0A086SXU7_HAPC1|nr:hypothetical protein ACRE_073730 [Hapsidospora chrysogenum ATCC 11550]
MSQQRMLKGARPTQAPSGIPPPRPSSRQPSGQQPKSSIPTMRRERRKQQEAATASAHKPRRPNQREQHGRQTPPVAVPSPNSNQTPVGWHDPAGGRLTPTYSPPFDDDSQGYGVSTTITSHTSREAQTPSPSLGHRIRQFGKGKPEPIENRPAWNGASGRQTLVEPVRDDTNVAPLSIPPKSSRRDDRAQGSRVRNNNPTSSRESETSYGQPDPSNTGRRAVPPRTGQTPEPDRSPITESATHYATQSAQPYPSPPTRSSPAPQTQPTAAPRSNRNSPPPPLVIPDRDKAIKRKPPPSHAVHPSTSSSIYSTQPPEGPGLTAPSDAVNTASLKHPVSGEGWVQPSSRFSVTTYATSATGSPRQSQESEQPPVPKVPSTASVMDRGKPVRGKESPSTSGDDPLVISLRPASGANAVTGHGYEKKPRRTATDIMKSERSASISSTSKALPPAPPEMVESKDRVVVLNAKLEALAHRRNNITRSIKQMTELMPADRLMESAEVLRKREEEKKKVENLKEELAEIQQQEYDLGLKLHRAYKRQEREAGYESGTLWVRRFTE